MLQFMLRRLLIVVPMMFLISVVSFAIIQAPPGDYVTAYVAKRYAAFEPVSPDEEEELRRLYGLDSSAVVQYVKWMGRLLRGDLGLSLSHEKPVSELLADRVLLTVALSGLTIVFVWTLAIPIGVISAVKQYSVIDYVLTFWSYLGIGTPNFLLALVIMWLVLDNFGWSVGGLFSPDYIEAPWSFGRVIDVLKHIWIPMLILGTDGTAGLTRIVRANLLDELHKPYVLTARSKGLPRWQVVFNYPLRIALNPFFSGVGYALPTLFSGATILGVVLGLPIVGPLLLEGVLNEDMFLAGSLLFMLTGLTLVGTFLSDLALAWADPRIRITG